MTVMAPEKPLVTRPIASIRPGETAKLVRTVTRDDIEAFASISGDRNPLHVDADYARRTSFQKPVAHGMLLGCYVSTLIGMHLPGPGALWNQQNFKWLAPVFAGDTITVEARVKQVSAGANTLTIEVNAMNQNGTKVMEGEGTVMVLTPQEKPAARAVSERVVFISGASRGIGAATAIEFARAGASVAVNYLSQAGRAAVVCAEIAAAGGKAIAVQADITDAEAVRRAMDQIANEFGQAVDVLVNNASPVFTPKPFLDAQWDDMQLMLDVQLRGAFLATQAALPAMLAAGSGVIVNIGSSLTRAVPPAQWTAFVAAKSALAGFTRSLAAEFGPKGIRVNMVSPGTTETEAIAAVPERLRKVQAMQTPLRRLAAPEDVARTVVFLCSDGAQFITGADIPVSGGAAI